MPAARYEGVSVGRDLIHIGRDVIQVTEDRSYHVGGLPNPYLGLASFTYAERAWYAGRERTVAQAVAQLTVPGQQRTLLFVTGASGSGKSSFTQAGLLPALEQFYGGRQQQVRWAAVRPSSLPLDSMIDALTQLGLAAHRLTPEAILREPGRLAQFIRDTTPPLQINAVVIDQFEELFTQSHTAQRDALFALLAALPPFAELRTHIIATMRADYLPELFQHRSLYDHAKQGIELRAMDEQELREAISHPLRALLQGLGRSVDEKRFEEALVARLARETAEDAACLPLLQMTLEGLWTGGRLTLSAYDRPDAYGSLGQAVRRRAEQVYGYTIGAAGQPQRRPPADQAMMLQIFLDLVEVSLDDDGRRDVRRRRTYEDLHHGSADRAGLIEELCNARLLIRTVERTEGGEVETDVVDIIHETLIRHWDRLGQMVADQRQRLQQRVRFEQAVGEWLGHDRADDYLVDGVRLAEARELAQRGDIALRRPQAPALLRQSVARQERRRQRQLRLAWTVVGVLALFLVIASVAVWHAGRQQRRAEEQTALALSRGLAAEARNYQPKQLDLALLLAVEAHRKAKTAEARQALYTALEASGSSIFLHGYWDRLLELAFSPDGRTLVARGTLGTLLLWDLRVPFPRPTPLEGHQGEVQALAFRPDGQTLVSGDERGTLLLWDLRETPPARKILGGHQDGVRALGFSRDGTQLASGDLHGTLLLWDLTTSPPQATPLPDSQGIPDKFTFSPDGKAVTVVNHKGALLVWELPVTTPSSMSLTSPQGDVRALTLSPNGRSFALGDSAGTLLVWDLSATPPRSLSLAGHQGDVRALALSSDGHILASGDQSSTLLLWDLRKTPLHSTDLSALSRHQDAIRRLALSPNGKLLASGDGRGTLLLWGLRGTKPRPIPLSGHRGPIEGLTFSPDGTALASKDSHGTFLLWGLDEGPPVQAFISGRRDGVSHFTFSPDGTTLASVDYDGAFLVWDLRASRPVRTPLRGHRGQVEALIFSPDGQTLAVHALDSRPLLWDLRVLPPHPIFLGQHRGAVGALVLSPDGKRLASDSGRDIRLWDLTATPPRSTTLSSHQANVWRLRFSSDGNTLVSGDESGTLLLWDLRMPHPQSIPLAGHQGRVQTFTFSPDGKTLASGDNAGALLLWDLRGTSPISTSLPGHQASVSMLAFNPNAHERMLVSGDDKSTLLVWDLRMTPPRSTDLPGHPGYRRSFAFSPDGQTLAVDIDEGSVLLWDLSTGLPRSTSLAGRQEGVTALRFSPDGRSLASGDIQGRLLLWDLRTRQPRFRFFFGYQEFVRAFTFSPDSKMLASGDQEGTLLLWDLSVTPPMSILLPHDQRYARPLTFSPDGKTLATGGNGGPMLWNLDFDSWPNHACRIANRNLTCAEWAQFIKDEPYRPTCGHLPFETCETGLTGKLTFE